MRVYKFTCSDDALPMLRYAPGDVSIQKTYQDANWTVFVTVMYEPDPVVGNPISCVPIIERSPVGGGHKWNFNYSEL